MTTPDRAARAAAILARAEAATTITAAGPAAAPGDPNDLTDAQRADAAFHGQVTEPDTDPFDIPEWVNRDPAETRPAATNWTVHAGPGQFDPVVSRTLAGGAFTGPVTADPGPNSATLEDVLTGLQARLDSLHETVQAELNGLHAETDWLADRLSPASPATTAPAPAPVPAGTGFGRRAGDRPRHARTARLDDLIDRLHPWSFLTGGLIGTVVTALGSWAALS